MVSNNVTFIHVIVIIRYITVVPSKAWVYLWKIAVILINANLHHCTFQVLHYFRFSICSALPVGYMAEASLY